MSGFAPAGGPISPGGSGETLVIDTRLTSPRQMVVAYICPGVPSDQPTSRVH
jgi:hypothetical protein